jgi:DNA-binding beta-propeller fold protein YncE
MKMRIEDTALCLMLFVLPAASLVQSQQAIPGVLMVGTQPVAVGINPITSQAFVLNKGSQDVAVVDLRSRSVVGKYLIGGSPEGIAVNPQTNQVVVTNLNSAVTIIDHRKGEIIATILAGKAPSRVAIDTKRNAALVTNFNGSNMVVIDLAALKIIRTIPLKNGPLGIAVLEDKRSAVVAQQYDMELAQINLDTGAVAKVLNIGRYLSEAAANPQTGMVVVVNPSSNGILTVYDPALNSVASTLAVGAGPLYVSVYPKRNVALVSEYNSDRVSLVDLNLNRVVRSLPVAKGPAGLAIDPATGMALVTNKLNGSVTFLDLEALLK